MGYNQEDSLVFNQASVDRGLFDITRYVPYYAEVKKTKDEEFAVPVAHSRAVLPPPSLKSTSRYCCKIRGDTAKVDPTACHVLTRAAIAEKRALHGVESLVTKDTIVRKGDILIGRVVKNTQSLYSEPFQDVSTVYNEHVPGRVVRAERGLNAAGYECILIVVAQQRSPVVGDKFASVHAQKGTIGKIVPAVDLPFTKDGIIPDAIINPLAFPSRMTIAMFAEGLAGKAVCLSPVLNRTFARDYFLGDGTPFDADKVAEIERDLAKHGLQPRGKEMMTNGMTGKPLPAAIFIAPFAYQRLKHMVVDKLHARARGTHASITRQPKEGRQFGGGFRVGYMERDNLASQGAAGFLRDRLLENSDDYATGYCARCGMQAVVIKDGRSECTLCNSRDIRKIRHPYATKLLMHELQGMNAVMRVVPESYEAPTEPEQGLGLSGI